jgi:hypothetical protein
MASKVSRKAYADLEERAKRLSTRLRNNTKGKAMDVADAAVCAAGGVTSGALVYYKPELGGIDTRALAAAALLFAGFGGITKGKTAKMTMLHGAGIAACYLEDQTITGIAKYEADKDTEVPS